MGLKYAYGFCIINTYSFLPCGISGEDGQKEQSEESRSHESYMKLG